MGEQGRPHGFRTSFRTWVQDTDACAYDVAETILAHSIGGKVERSYARSDLLDRRRVAMAAWSAHVTGEASNVVKVFR
jgi:integrase